MLLLVSAVASLLALVSASEYTVTDEAWFEVEVKDLDGPGNSYRGKFTVALFGEVVPMTVLNFVKLTKGFKKREDVLTYKDTIIHRIVPDFVIQMGDVLSKTGHSGTSIYGRKFNDEDFALSHRSPGWVSMANTGKDSNASQFFIILSKARWLDGKHVVFGKVIRGYETIRKLGELPSDPKTAIPQHSVRIVDCGVNHLDKKYELRQDQLDLTEDI